MKIKKNLCHNCQRPLELIVCYCTNQIPSANKYYCANCRKHY